jgi:hypothetical protein
MNCEEVQKYLLDFVEESVDVERFREIASHLAACEICSDEMAGLAECQRLVATLPAVEPPINFTARVMAEVREAARPPSFWKHWFLPLKTKLPLQATALVLIAVLAAYIYRKEPLQQQSVVSISPAPSERHGTDKVAPPTAQPPKVDSRIKTAQKSDRAPLQKELTDRAESKAPEALTKPAEQRQDPTLRPGAPATAFSQEQVQPPATLTPVPKSTPEREVVSPRAEPSSPSAPAQAKGPSVNPALNETDSISKGKPSTGKSLSPLQSREAASASLDTLRSGAVVPADHEFVIRLKQPAKNEHAAADRSQPEHAQFGARSSVSPPELKNLEQARRRAIETAEPQTVWLTIAPKQYEPFKETLAGLGHSEMETPTVGRKKDAGSNLSNSLHIKVTIFPPLSSQSPLPTAPSPR